MLKITVTGATGEGKTTLSMFIAAVLRRAGFGVIETDEDVNTGNHLPHLREERLASVVKAAQSIVMETQQATKAPLTYARSLGAQESMKIACDSVKESASDAQPSAQPALTLYTFRWSTNCSAGTVHVVEANRDAAWKSACKHFAADELSLDDEEEVKAGIVSCITTDYRSL